MINLRQQTVNVRRLDLIDALKGGLSLHRSQFIEADLDYKAAVLAFQAEAQARTARGDFSDFRMNLHAPENKSQEYVDVIEMMEVSVDDVVQIDKDAFKAFYKNEWPWTAGFLAASAGYKTELGKLMK
jgi:hypothetical protein